MGTQEDMTVDPWKRYSPYEGWKPFYRVLLYQTYRDYTDDPDTRRKFTPSYFTYSPKSFSRLAVNAGHVRVALVAVLK